MALLEKSSPRFRGRQWGLTAAGRGHGRSVGAAPVRPCWHVRGCLGQSVSSRVSFVTLEQSAGQARGNRLRGRTAGHPHRALRHLQEEGTVADPLRGGPLHHQPRPGRDHAGRPARPRPRPLADRARPLATRRDLERGQITHPYRKRPSGHIRHHQPRHQPLPHTRSNQLHSRDPPLRPGPPPRTPDPRPRSTLTWLNAKPDFGKPLQQQVQRVTKRNWSASRSRTCNRR